MTAHQEAISPDLAAYTETAKILDVLTQRHERIPLSNRNPTVDHTGLVQFQLVDGTDLELSTRRYGKPGGHPIILMHGTPGSHIMPRPRSLFLVDAGIELFTYSRRGYPNSTRHIGRIVADIATDVEAIARAYRIKRKISVAGRSGGAPGALAAAALLPERVINAAVFSCMCPPEMRGSSGMTEENAAAFTDEALTVAGLARLATLLRELGTASVQDITARLRYIQPNLGPDDQRFLRKYAGMKRLIGNSHSSAGFGDGNLDDALSLAYPWGFNLGQIEQPVWLIQGEEKSESGAGSLTPAEHFHQLRNSLLHPMGLEAPLPNVGHIQTLEYAPSVFLAQRNHALKSILDTPIHIHDSGVGY